MLKSIVAELHIRYCDIKNLYGDKKHGWYHQSITHYIILSRVFSLEYHFYGYFEEDNMELYKHIIGKKIERMMRLQMLLKLLDQLL